MTSGQALEALEARVMLSGATASARLAAAANQAPVIGNVGGDVSFTEGTDPTRIANQATISDADSTRFSGGRLTVTLTANAQVDDQLLIRNEGLGNGQIGVSGSRVYYSGRSIGTVSGGRGSTPLTIAFNSNATPAAAQALLRNIGFGTASQNPSTLPRGLSIVVNDGAGGVSSPATKSVQVIAVNDPPVIGNLGSGVVYSESPGTPVVVSPSATVTDVDSGNFAGGILTVQIGQNAGAGDALSIRNQGTAAGQISLTGNVVTYGGVAIGTATGLGTASLSISLTAAANAVSIQALSRNVTFANMGVNPSSSTRRINFQLSDGDGGTSTVASTFVSIATVNDAPVISTFGPDVNYVRGDEPEFLSPTATVTDADSTNFSGGRLTVRITANVRSSDGIAIYSEGFGPGQLGVDGSSIYYGDVLFGQVSGGLGSTPLTVTFNSNATPAAVQALTRNLGFFTGGSSSTATRQITLTVTDGDGGTSAAVSKNVLLT